MAIPPIEASLGNGTTAKVLRNLQSLPFVFQTLGVRVASFYIFPINPQSYSLTFPSRGSIIQTMNGNFENFFGAGVVRGSLRGTFGFGIRPQWGLAGLPLPGYLQSRYLELLATTFYNELQVTVRDNQAAWNFMDLTDVHFMKIRLRQFQFERATTHNFLINFNIDFDVIQDYLNPNQLPGGTILADLSNPAALITRLTNAVGTIDIMPDALKAAFTTKIETTEQDITGGQTNQQSLSIEVFRESDLNP